MTRLIDDYLDAYGESDPARRSPAGQAVLEGCDFAQVDASGRLAQVAGFFGPLPAHESAA